MARTYGCLFLLTLSSCIMIQRHVVSIYKQLQFKHICFITPLNCFWFRKHAHIISRFRGGLHRYISDPYIIDINKQPFKKKIKLPICEYMQRFEIGYRHIICISLPIMMQYHTKLQIISMWLHFAGWSHLVIIFTKVATLWLCKYRCFSFLSAFGSILAARLKMQVGCWDLNIGHQNSRTRNSHQGDKSLIPPLGLSVLLWIYLFGRISYALAVLDNYELYAKCCWKCCEIMDFLQKKTLPILDFIQI